MLKEYLQRLLKAHPKWVSFLVKKQGVDFDGTINSILVAYKKGGSKFLSEWYSTFHSPYLRADGDSWFDSFSSWFSDAVTVMEGSTAIAQQVNSGLNPDQSANKKLTENEMYQKKERVVWGVFIGISILAIITLLILTFIRRK